MRRSQVLTTYDWVPESPRGYVRDIRVRWALEEAGLPYRVESVSFRTRTPAHFARQPFGQVPFLSDGDLSIFESGAILLHLAEKSEALMPRDAQGRAETLEWVFAALNSVELAVMPWAMWKFSGDTTETPVRKQFNDFLESRLTHMETELARREWLAGRFTVADILMVEVLRVVDRLEGLRNKTVCKSYVDRATARPAFAKAHADQIAHFAAADAA